MTDKNVFPLHKWYSSKTPVKTLWLFHQLGKIWIAIESILWNTPSRKEIYTEEFISTIEQYPQIIQKLINQILSKEETICALKKEKEEELVNQKRNTSIMMKLHSINMELRSGWGIETVVDAILHIEQAIQEKFPWVSTHIILTPIRDKDGSIVENPLAQMLADEIEMMNKRFSDPDFIETPTETKQKEKLERLATLLPLSEWALKKWALPSELVVLWSNNLFSRHNFKQSHHLTKKMLTQLDSAIFGNIWSAIALDIPGIGKFLLSSENPDHFNKEQDTMLVRNATEILWMSLSYIGEKENNIKDSLTWLPLRRSFTEKAQIIFEEAKHNKTHISFVIIDVDRFKRVNDTYGHPMGDLVLKTLARILRLKLKTEDKVVRWGGEEFWVLMQTNVDESHRAVKRAFDAIKEIHFQIDSKGVLSIFNPHKGTHSLSNPHDSHTFSITLSAGIACNKDMNSDIPPSELTLDNLITEADKRLYVAKQTGRDKVVSK